MRYSEFEDIVSEPRMRRYLTACNGNTRKALTLYRYNLILSRELFTIISCFEVALRNKIDQHYLDLHGDDWLRDAVGTDGIYMKRSCRNAAKIIQDALRKLEQNYSHPKLIAELGFGFWRYQFANPQFNAAGSTLLRIFPSKPRSTPIRQINNQAIFSKLAQINKLRNRIAHHEPVCFSARLSVISTQNASDMYLLLLELFSWMEIDERNILYGVDHVSKTTQRIDNLL